MEKHIFSYQVSRSNREIRVAEKSLFQFKYGHTL